MSREEQVAITSSIYVGRVQHRRYTPKHHQFSYRLYMLAIDIDELAELVKASWVFGVNWWQPIRFVEKDYLPSEPGSLKQRIENKVKLLGGNDEISKVVMLVQARCFGIYFSPANFYFCYDKQDECRYMLCEVSNTPWNQRHYYLVDLASEKVSDKAFHVSPFMDLAMHYHWRINPPSDKQRLFVGIENRRGVGRASEKLFDAQVILKKRTWTNEVLKNVIQHLPVMTWSIVTGIYWQALRLFLKKIPFVPYQQSKKIDGQ